MDLFKRAINLSVSILLISFLTSATLDGQMKSGYRFGINLTSMSIEKNGSRIPAQTPVGIQFGGMYEIPLSKKFTMQSGFLLTSKGTDYKMDNLDYSIAPAYFELPLQAARYFGMRRVKFLLFAGPYFSAAFGGYKIESGGMQDLTFGPGFRKDLKDLDWGLNAGAGLNIKGFVISAQYGAGLRNVSPKNGIIMRNKVIGISIGTLLLPPKR